MAVSQIGEFPIPSYTKTAEYALENSHSFGHCLRSYAKQAQKTQRFCTYIK